MVDFLLIHGGAHGSWCWERVIPHLQASHHTRRVFANDLAADAQAAVDKPKAEITNSDYVEGVIRKIRELGLNDIILVGHSMAGITIPEVCHRLPDRIKRVVYITTSNPLVGQSIVDLMAHPLSPKSRNVGFDEMFCNDLDEESARWLKSHLQDDPPLPVRDRVNYCALPDGIPSTYIVCLKDGALPVEYQREQAANAGADEVVELDAGHSAFLSQPVALAELLLHCAQRE
jgi:pimeloyl-ACP methyl ester carboxylesterase